jgi:hypothetical protein
MTDNAGNVLANFLLNSSANHAAYFYTNEFASRSQSGVSCV